jgi:5-methylcytosine-specific restriction enzyme A
MGFQHGLTIGQRLSTKKIQEIFNHNINGGMKRSLSTNTLVLISDHYESPYSDKWINGTLHYNGMGLEGNQKLVSHNKTLAHSNENGVEVFLFEAFDNSNDKHVFMGRVKVIDEPYKERQFDDKGNLRDVWVFPLKPLDISNDLPIVNFKTMKIANNSMVKKRKLKKLNTKEIEDRAKNFDGRPSVRDAKASFVERNIYVSQYAKIRAQGICDLCEEPAPFNTSKGEPYLETHHIVWLSKGGLDSLDNTVALCPNCHRKMHSLNKVSDVKKLKTKYKNGTG